MALFFNYMIQLIKAFFVYQPFYLYLHSSILGILCTIVNVFTSLYDIYWLFSSFEKRQHDFTTFVDKLEQFNFRI